MLECGRRVEEWIRNGIEWTDGVRHEEFGFRDSPLSRDDLDN